MKKVNQVEHREATEKDYLEGRATYDRARLVSGEEIRIFRFISPESKVIRPSKIGDKVENICIWTLMILFSPILLLWFYIDEKRSKKPTSKQRGGMDKEYGID